MSLADVPAVARLIRQQRRRLRGQLALAAGAALVAAAAAIALLGLSGWFITGAALAGAAGLAAAQAFNVLLPSAAVRLLAILRTVLRYLERLIGHRAALSALAQIRPALFAAIATAPPGKSLGLSRGEGAARLVQDVDAIETDVMRTAQPWAAGAALVLGVSAGACAGWASGAAAGATGIALLMITPALARRLTRKPGAALQGAMGELKTAAAVYAGAAAELRCYGLEPWARDEIAARGRVLGQAQQAMTRAQGLTALIQALIAGLGVAFVLLMARHATPPLAAMAALATVVMGEMLSATARAALDDGRTDEARRRLEPWLAEVVHVCAPELGTPALAVAGIDFAPGSRLLLAGASGAGKTSLMHGLLGLQAATAGRLRVAECDLADLPPGAARGAFSICPQDAALLSGTVRENLRLADAAASDDALWAALHDAGLDVVVRGLPQGLDSWIGEDGARLSGGERRRLCLARALLRPAAWLLLDEPTEGLDAFTEALVVRRLRQRLDRTGQGLILASHRQAPRSLCSRTLQVGPDQAALARVERQGAR